ncbi:Guanylate kinase family protein [Leishmania donovani]|uniref:Guanylate kinase family protein n=1 Tax=Leishmania donovani TaxID=5661 RepID=A0A504X1S6_LEIDO|nr:Guanylate kinase family protein [Leishmania donovani]
MSVAPKAPMPAISSVAAASAAHKTAQQAVGPLKGTVALRRLVDMLLFVGPSGSGKSTVIRRLQRDWPTLFEFSVSHTTRCPRRGEVHGQHYYFVTMEEFQQLVDAGHMIEYSRLCMPETSSSTPPLSKPVGNLYGTSKKALHTVLARNRVVLMDTDLLGAINIRRYCSREVVSTRPVTNEHAADPTTANPSKDSMLPSSPFYAAPVVTRTLRCMIIFIAPPSMQVLEQRLRERKTETEASIQLRMKVNRQWMQWAKENQSFFDHYIVNDNLDLCYAKVREIVRAEVLMVDSTL